MLYYIDKNIERKYELEKRLGKCEVMDKIFDAALAVALAVFMVNTVPVVACSSSTAGVTGSACSISDINNRIENKANPEKNVKMAKPERNLRPVRIMGQYIENSEYEPSCPIGPCIYRMLFK